MHGCVILKPDLIDATLKIKMPMLMKIVHQIMHLIKSNEFSGKTPQISKPGKNKSDVFSKQRESFVIPTAMIS